MSRASLRAPSRRRLERFSEPCVLLGKIAIGDWLTLLVGLASLAALFLFRRLSNPLLVGVTAVIGLIAFPLLQPGWVMVK